MHTHKNKNESFKITYELSRNIHPLKTGDIKVKFFFYYWAEMLGQVTHTSDFGMYTTKSLYGKDLDQVTEPP